VTVEASSINSSRWFVCPKPNPQAKTRLFIFPYAGGSPAAFNKWSREFPGNIEVWIVHYPGRASRYNEKLITDVSILVEGIYEAFQSFLDKPFAFFGHSMGALIAFELVRSLRQNNLPQPITLFVSACGAPHIGNPHKPIHSLPEAGFIKALGDLNGTPMELLNNAELMELVLPAIRADFHVVENYHFVGDTPLQSPIIAFGGLDDPRISRERLEGWAFQTSSSFSSEYFPGDHFFINTASKWVISSITEALISSSA
jgi:medium-chain acyl-[acyl-carrier-protein] hydrolase